MGDNAPHDLPLDAFFEALYTLRPVDATFIGMHAHDHRLPDWSPAGHEAARARWQRVAKDLRASGHARTLATLPDDAATDWRTVDGALALSHVEVSLAELDGHHLTRGNPSLAIGEAAFSVISLITREFAPAGQRAAWLLPRLRALPRFLAGALGTLSSTPIAPAWRERALREAAATERLLLEGVPMWAASMGLAEDRREALVDAAQSAAGATAAFAATLGTLAASPVEAPAAGEGLLETCVARGHWIEASLDELRREVVAALPEHRALLAERIHAAGASSLAEVQDRLAARHPTSETFLDAFTKCWAACREASDAHDLVTWPPGWPVRYVPIPPWTRMAAPSLYYLFYRSPAPFDTVVPHEYVVAPLEGVDDTTRTRLLAAWNDSVIKLNHVVHHGALGHHVQNWYAVRAPSRVGRVAAADCASRIAMIQGGTMAEGWACYATDLMEEVGFLTGDERVAEQHTRVRMLARALVDIEFHTGRWSLADAIRCYVDEVGMTVDAARNEAVKNSMFPGTALMYWFGTQGVHAARREASARMGPAFTLREFHDRFLSHGAIPVTVIRRLMAAGGNGVMTPGITG